MFQDALPTQLKPVQDKTKKHIKTLFNSHLYCKFQHCSNIKPYGQARSQNLLIVKITHYMYKEKHLQNKGMKFNIKH